VKGWLLHPENELNQLRYRSREPLRVAQQRDLRFQIFDPLVQRYLRL
jgi:hypothetical protein